MNIYYCCRCNRILTEWEIITNRLKCNCGSHQFTGADPSYWYLVKTFQFFRVYTHAFLFWHLKDKGLDNA